MRIDVITLFPGLFPGPLAESIPGRALERGAAGHQVDRRLAHAARVEEGDQGWIGFGQHMGIVTKNHLPGNCQYPGKCEIHSSLHALGSLT